MTADLNISLFTHEFCPMTKRYATNKCWMECKMFVGKKKTDGSAEQMKGGAVGFDF